MGKREGVHLYTPSPLIIPGAPGEVQVRTKRGAPQHQARCSCSLRWVLLFTGRGAGVHRERCKCAPGEVRAPTGCLPPGTPAPGATPGLSSPREPIT